MSKAHKELRPLRMLTATVVNKQECERISEALMHAGITHVNEEKRTTRGTESVRILVPRDVYNMAVEVVKHILPPAPKES